MSGLSDFRNYFTSFLGVAAAGVASSAFVLAASLIGISPPWPKGILQITAITQLIVLVFVYQKLQGASRRRIEGRMNLALVCLLLTFPCYMALHSLLIYNMPNGDMGMRGLVCTVEAKRIFIDSCPFLQSEQISTGTYEAERFWTPLGLLSSRMAILTLWISAFVSLVNLLAAFVVFQRSRRPT